MGFRDANRAQAIQVGAILLFALLILGISIYQATVVPQQNARIEFDAYQATTDDMVSVRDDVVTAGTEGASASTTVTTGATYPARSLFINPGAPSGTVSTDSAPNVTVEEVRAVESEAENIRAFWNSTSGTYETSRVTFTPSYNEIDASPVTVAGQGVYRLPDDRVLPISTGSSIRGNRITLVTVRGDLGAAGRSVPVTADPVSTATRTVVVTGTGTTFNVTVPTPIPASAWNDTVAPDVVANPNVLTTTPVGDDAVRITFDGTRQYELRLAAVELRAQSDSSVVDSPGGAYLVGLTDNETVATGRTRPVAVEVRDRYDNPVGGEAVTFTVEEGGYLTGNVTERTITTDGEGRARIGFTPNTTGDVAVSAEADLDDDGSIVTYERTTFGFASVDPDDLDGGAEEINPSEEGDVILEYGETSSSSNKDTVTVSFNNTAGETRTIAEARIGFYYASGPSATPPRTITVGGTDLSVPSTLTELDSPPSLSSGPGQTVTLTANQGSGVPVPNDFVVLSITFAETGDTKTYFITLEKSGGGGNRGGGNQNN
ncbi:MAG: Ig-like domain-containing protein [Haloplanus sp.]